MSKHKLIRTTILACVSALAAGCAGKAKPSLHSGPAASNRQFDPMADENARKHARQEQLKQRMREIMKTVYFPTEGFYLDEKSKAALAEIGGFMKKYPELSLSIGGYCDERGSDEYNLALGERRAKAVSDYLRAYGIAENRIRIVSYGEESPALDGHDEQAYRLNRRAEFGSPM